MDDNIDEVYISKKETHLFLYFNTIKNIYIKKAKSYDKNQKI